MTQTLYAYMNKRKKKCVGASHSKTSFIVRMFPYFLPEARYCLFSLRCRHCLIFKVLAGLRFLSPMSVLVCIGLS
jgi:hypothetical protein